MELKELNIKTNNICECGYKFNIHDITKLERIEDNSFFGGIVKHYSKTYCSNCGKETILLLKQAGQTYTIKGIGTNNNRNEELVKTHSENIQNVENNQDNTNSNEFICPVCQKVCKSKIGYSSHMKTHEN